MLTRLAVHVLRLLRSRYPSAPSAQACSYQPANLPIRLWSILCGSASLHQVRYADLCTFPSWTSGRENSFIRELRSHCSHKVRNECSLISEFVCGEPNLRTNCSSFPQEAPPPSRWRRRRRRACCSPRPKGRSSPWPEERSSPWPKERSSPWPVYPQDRGEDAELYRATS